MADTMLDASEVFSLQIGKANLAIFERAVYCLGRMGKELFIDVRERAIKLSTLTDSKQAFGQVEFRRNFFEVYRIALARTPEDSIACKLAIKSLQVAFRGLRGVSCMTMSCGIDGADDATIAGDGAKEHVLRVSLKDAHGVFKTYRLNYQDTDIYHPKFDVAACPNTVTVNAKQMYEVLQHIHGADEITMGAQRSEMKFSSVPLSLDDTDMYQAVSSALSMRREEFVDYGIQRPCQATFCLSEFKAFLQFCVHKAANVDNARLLFSRAHQPLMLTTDTGGVAGHNQRTFSAQLVMSTGAHGKRVPDDATAEAGLASSADVQASEMDDGARRSRGESQGETQFDISVDMDVDASINTDTQILQSALIVAATNGRRNVGQAHGEQQQLSRREGPWLRECEDPMDADADRDDNDSMLARLGRFTPIIHDGCSRMQGQQPAHEDGSLVLTLQRRRGTSDTPSPQQKRRRHKGPPLPPGALLHRRLHGGGDDDDASPRPCGKRRDGRSQYNPPLPGPKQHHCQSPRREPGAPDRAEDFGGYVTIESSVLSPPVWPRASRGGGVVVAETDESFVEDSQESPGSAAASAKEHFSFRQEVTPHVQQHYGRSGSRSHERRRGEASGGGRRGEGRRLSSRMSVHDDHGDDDERLQRWSAKSCSSSSPSRGRSDIGGVNNNAEEVMDDDDEVVLDSQDEQSDESCFFDRGGLAAAASSASHRQRQGGRWRDAADGEESDASRMVAGSGSSYRSTGSVRGTTAGKTRKQKSSPYYKKRRVR